MNYKELNDITLTFIGHIRRKNLLKNGYSQEEAMQVLLESDKTLQDKRDADLFKIMFNYRENKHSNYENRNPIL